MTATTAPPLETLAQQIARQQAELEALRQELAGRQSQLSDLNRHREELQAQLQQVQADIQATTEGGHLLPALTPKKGASAKPAAPPASQPKASAKPAAAPPQPPPVRKHTLPALLVEIVGKAHGPLTVKQLAEEVVHRKFPTTSSNLAGMIETRVGDLVKRGFLQRASDQPGVVPATLATRAKAPTVKAASGPKDGTVVHKATPPTKSQDQAKHLSLRAILTNLLAKSRRPLAVRELAEQVLAGGYPTKSKDFLHVVWDALGKMDDVENVPGKGYTLNKRFIVSFAVTPKATNDAVTYFRVLVEPTTAEMTVLMDRNLDDFIGDTLQGFIPLHGSPWT